MKHHAVALIYALLVAACSSWLASRGVLELGVIAVVTAALGLVLAYGRNLRFMGRVEEGMVIVYSGLGTFAVLATMIGDMTVRYTGETGTFRPTGLSIEFGPQLGVLVVVIGTVSVVSILLLLLPHMVFRALDWRAGAQSA